MLVEYGSTVQQLRNGFDVGGGGDCGWVGHGRERGKIVEKII